MLRAILTLNKQQKQQNARKNAQKTMNHLQKNVLIENMKN